MRKQETIKVKNINDGVVKPLKYQHAERLLNLEKKIGVLNYVIDDPEFAFENGTIVRRSNSENKKANKRRLAQKGEV
jgi:hypothetical protein